MKATIALSLSLSGGVCGDLAQRCSGAPPAVLYVCSSGFCSLQSPGCGVAAVPILYTSENTGLLYMNITAPKVMQVGWFSLWYLFASSECLL